MSHRPTVYGTRHAVSAGHYLAAAAAFSVLEAGGNAIDAGCAAGIALGVLQPDLVNVAGVAPIMIRLANGHVESIAGLGWWPKTLPADIFMREHGGKIPDGVLRTVIPAAPDAWITALERHGTMRFADVASYAIRYAGEGFAVYPLLATSIAAHEHEYRRWPSNTAIFLPNDRVPKSGDKFVQSDLARTLQYMADQDRAAGPDRAAGLRAAHDAFYRGDIAREIVAVPAAGGRLSVDGRPRRIPLAHRAGGAAAVARPRGDHLRPVVPGTGAAGGAGAARARRHRRPAAQLRDLPAPHRRVREPGDGGPRVLSSAIRPSSTCRSTTCSIRRPSRGAPPRCATTARSARCRRRSIAPTCRTRRSTAELPKVEADTSYCCVVDRWGNAFSATPSDGSGNVPVVPGLGITPSGRGSQSRPDPRHPAGVAPGKRPRLTPNPAMVVTEAGGVMPFGTPGGDVQTQAMLQVLLNIFQHGMEVQDAIEAPRVASYSFPSSFAPFEYFPGRLAVEGRIDRGGAGRSRRRAGTT